MSAPQAHFKVAEDAVKLSLEQEEQVTSQINALVSMAKAESDYTTDNFLQWFIKEQLEGSGANFLGICFCLARGFSDFKPPGLRPIILQRLRLCQLGV